MSFEWFVSLRYLKAKRRQTFISVISICSVGGVALGVCALIVVLAVMNGFRHNWRDRILGVTAHAVILSYDGGVADYPAVVGAAGEEAGVVAATPFIYGQAMIAAGSRVLGLVVRGVEPATVARVTKLKESLLSHDLGRLSQKAVDPRPESKGREIETIILGQELARNLGVDVGSLVRLISPFGEETPFGRKPKARDFLVSDLFRSGMYEYDSSLAYLSLGAAQRFFGLGQSVTGVEVKVGDIYAAAEVAERLAKRLGYPYWTRNWMEMNRNLFSALKLEKTAMFIILILIVLVAAFNIVSTLIMVVMEKTKDIAILKSIGARTSSIRKIFVYQGLTIGLVGTAFGLALGLVLCEILRRYQFIKLPSDIYYISTLPVRVDPLDVGLIALAAVAISFLATIYPSFQGARLNPVEALRYE